MLGLSVDSFEIRLRNQAGLEIVWVLHEPLRFVRNPEDAVRAAQVFMDTLRSEARDMGVSVGQGFKSVQKIGKGW